MVTHSEGADTENLILDSDDDSEAESYENESCKKVTKNIHAYSLLFQAKLEFQSAIMKFEGPVRCLLLVPFKMQERKQFDASHFGTGSQAGFVSGAIDNMNMKDKSSASWTKITDYRALVSFQDATEKVTRKPDTRCWKISLTEVLSCK